MNKPAPKEAVKKPPLREGDEKPLFSLVKIRQSGRLRWGKP
jgi:hypothetical protein